MPATVPYIPRIGLVFDFDGTLAPDGLDAVLGAWDLPREVWAERFRDPLGDEGWDDLLRRSLALVHAGRACGRPLTRELFVEAAHQRLPLYEGVLEMPARLRRLARSLHEAVEIELHVLSSGFCEYIEATAVGRMFDAVWASAFHFDDRGEAVGLKRMISHPEKTLFLEAIGKGLPVGGSNSPEYAVQDVDAYDVHVPFDQMIYVGDGHSDLHAFGFLMRRGGWAIAVDGGPRGFDAADDQTAAQRVENVAPPTYAAGSGLMTSLEHAVRGCASRIALRARSRGS